MYFAPSRKYSSRALPRTQMDWSVLPGNVLQLIRDLLPSRQIGVLRLVCKTWSVQINGSIKSLVTNAVCPQPVPVTRLPILFPNLTDLDLSCHVWGCGQSLTSEYCCQLEYLKTLKNLKSLRLVNWVTLSLIGMKCIVGLEQVEYLDLTNCMSITDIFLQCFDRAKTSLKHLILNGCERITDQGISHIASALELVELRVAHIPGIVGKTLCELNAKLECLDVSYCENLSDEGVRLLVDKSGYVSILEYLDVSGCPKLHSSTLSLFHSFSNLSKLKVSCLPQLSEIEKWNGLKSLKVLDVSFASGLVMQNALPIIAQMTQLRSLRLDGCPLLQGVRPEHLKDLQQLRCLDLGRWSNLQFGLDITDTLKNLEVLNLADGGGCIRSQNKYFKHAARLKVLGLSGYAYLPMNVIHGLSTVSSLEVLNLSRLGNLNDRMVQAISKLTSLTYLDLSQNGVYTKVTNFGAKYLRSLSLLKSLKISGWSEISSHAFLVLRQMKNLTSLDVSNCLKLTDKGVKAISSAKFLVELNLTNCFQVTSCGLTNLKKCVELETLVLSHHIKGDIENELPNIKNIQFTSPTDFVIDSGNTPIANFQQMLESLSREEKDDTPPSNV